MLGPLPFSVAAAHFYRAPAFGLLADVDGYRIIPALCRGRSRLAGQLVGRFPGARPLASTAGELQYGDSRGLVCIGGRRRLPRGPQTRNGHPSDRSPASWLYSCGAQHQSLKGATWKPIRTIRSGTPRQFQSFTTRPTLSCCCSSPVASWRLWWRCVRRSAPLKPPVLPSCVPLWVDTAARVSDYGIPFGFATSWLWLVLASAGTGLAALAWSVLRRTRQEHCGPVSDSGY